jgi:very-short-patch-repair endonuclease
MRGPDRKTVPRARQLRRDSTDAEMKLWLALRDRRLGGYKFVRQKPIKPFIADFVCREANLIVEVDGGQHNESLYDHRRGTFLNSEGYRVLRFWNNEVLTNLDGVLQTMLAALNSPDR